MKRTTLPTLATAGLIRCTTILTILASGFLATSCIYEKPAGDDFYRTLWKSDEIPLGPLDVKTLTLEFLCDEGVSISMDNGLKIYGTYSPDGATTVLNNLRTYFNSSNGLILTGEDSADRTSGEGSITVTFIEAHRNGDTLFLLWRVEDAIYPFTTAMQRLSDYGD